MDTQTVETGLSDFQKLILTVLKIHYAKPSTKIAAYRDYKNFSDESFRSDFHNETGRYHHFSFTDFNSIFLAVLNKQARIKKDTIMLIKKNFIDKILDQAIMVRYNLCNKFLKLKTAED